MAAAQVGGGRGWGFSRNFDAVIKIGKTWRICKHWRRGSENLRFFRERHIWSQKLFDYYKIINTYLFENSFKCCDKIK